MTENRDIKRGSPPNSTGGCNNSTSGGGKGKGGKKNPKTRPPKKDKPKPQEKEKHVSIERLRKTRINVENKMSMFPEYVRELKSHALDKGWEEVYVSINNLIPTKKETYVTAEYDPLDIAAADGTATRAEKNAIRKFDIDYNTEYKLQYGRYQQGMQFEKSLYNSIKEVTADSILATCASYSE